MNNLSNIFKAEANQSIAGGKNQLALTAKLTTESTVICNDLLADLNSQEDGAGKVRAMMEDNGAMNSEVSHYLTTTGYIGEWLKEASKDEAIKMLKSQQSKRSRAKSATMTLTNFKTMVTAAIAEELLRRNHSIVRAAGGTGARTAELVLTDEMITSYTNDQALLGKAIRNVQSKKSIMKSKADFNEESEGWQALLSYEASLKSLRTTGGVDAKTAEKAKKADEVETMLSSIDVSKMKKDDLAAALEQMKSMMMSDNR